MNDSIKLFTGKDGNKFILNLDQCLSIDKDYSHMPLGLDKSKCSSYFITFRGTSSIFRNKYGLSVDLNDGDYCLIRDNCCPLHPYDYDDKMIVLCEEYTHNSIFVKIKNVQYIGKFGHDICAISVIDGLQCGNKICENVDTVMEIINKALHKDDCIGENLPEQEKLDSIFGKTE